MAKGQTGIKKLANGRFRARYFAGYNAAGKRVYPARTFDTQAAALKWRTEKVSNRIAARDTTRPLALQYLQGGVYTAPFAVPSVLKSTRGELLELHLPLANICCVYFLISATDEVLYVGQTTELHHRIKAHLRAGVKFSRALFIPVQAMDLLSTEAYFIKALNPPLNKSQRSNISSEPVEAVCDLVIAHSCA